MRQITTKEPRLVLAALSLLAACGGGSGGFVVSAATPEAARPRAELRLDPAEADALLHRVGKIRGLAPKARIPVTFVEDAEFDALYRSHLSPDDVRRGAVLSDPGPMAAFYVHATGAVVARRHGRPGANASAVIAHELEHALQRQHFPELVAPTPDATLDAALARAAVLEGDAVVVQSAVAASERGWPIRRTLLGLRGSFAAMSPAASSGAANEEPSRTLLSFVYGRGAAFVQSIYAAGGFALVDRVLRNPPRTTAEVLHPERYVAGLAPVPCRAPDLGPGARREVLGEIGLVLALTTYGVEPAKARELAAGWEGDEISSDGEAHAQALTLVASNAERLEPVFAAQGTVRRRGHVLGFARGTADDEHLAEEALAGAGTAPPAAPPVGAVTIPPVPPAIFERVSAAATPSGRELAVADFGMRFPLLDGARSKPASSGVLLNLAREDASANVQIVALRALDADLESARDALDEAVRLEIEKPSIRERAITTPIGGGIERTYAGADGTVRALVLRVCGVEALMTIVVFHAGERARADIDRWVAGIDAAGLQESRFCKAIHEEHTVEVP